MWKKVLAICLLALLFAGCSKKEVSGIVYVNLEQNSDQYVAGEDHQPYWNDLGASFASNITKAKEGYYHYDWSRRLLCYYDLQTAQSVPLCNQPDCEHDNENCNGFIDYETTIDCLKYYYGYLYVIGRNENDVCVYRISRDGTVRENIGTIVTVEGRCVASCIVHRGYVYYAMHSSTVSKDGVKIYRFCLNSNEEVEVIYTSKSRAGGEAKLSAYGNYLYIRESYPSASDYIGEVYRYQIHDATVEKVADGIWRGFAVNGNVLYYDNGTQIMARDLETGTETVVIENGMPVYLIHDGRWLICDNGCGIWLNGGDYSRRSITVYDCEEKKTVAVIPLEGQLSECVGSDGENIIAMIPEKEIDGNSYLEKLYLCNIADAVAGKAVWRAFEE